MAAVRTHGAPDGLHCRARVNADEDARIVDGGDQQSRHLTSVGHASDPRGFASGKHSKSVRRQFAKAVLEAKLSTAHTRIRQLELLVLTLDPGCNEATNFDTASVAIQREVSKRFDMARPALTTLVAAGVTGETQSVPGGARAFRNFGLHAELGCGIEGLPATSKEAKQRIRGGSRVYLSSVSSERCFC